MRRQRYLDKLEKFEEEFEFIEKHEIKNDVSRRALFYSLQVSVDVAMDIIAMLTKDMGLVVQDDYRNIQRLQDKGILSEDEASLLRRFNGIRNAVVHKYDDLDQTIIEEALDKTRDLYKILIKISKQYEKLAS